MKNGLFFIGGWRLSHEAMFWHTYLWDLHSLGEKESNNQTCFMILSIPSQHKLQRIPMAFVVKDNNHPHCKILFFLRVLKYLCQCAPESTGTLTFFLLKLFVL
jgi:hypothetical protein